jgi:hypothetical protein
MSWVDAISQALGAGAQGIAGHEQIVRQRKDQALRQYQADQEAKDLKFRQIEKSINPGGAIDPALMPDIAAFGLTSRVTKGPDGQPMWADTLEDTKTRQEIETQGFLTDAAETRAQLASKEFKARQFITENADAYMQQPDLKRSIMWADAGFTGNRPQTLDELKQLQYANDAAMIRAAELRAGQMNQPRPVDPTRQALNQAQLQELQAKQLLKSMGGVESAGMPPMFPGQKDQKAARAAYMAALQQMMQQGQGAPAQAAQPGAAPKRKYQILGVE